MDFSKNINFMRKKPMRKVNRPIMQVGFQPFDEIPHRFLKKEVGKSPLETDMKFSFKVPLFAVISPKILTL
jgi:hypothetical protein